MEMFANGFFLAAGVTAFGVTASAAVVAAFVALQAVLFAVRRIRK